MKTLLKTSSCLLLLLTLLSCEKDPVNKDDQASSIFLQEHIFNGNTQWVLTDLEADTERVINGKNTTRWIEQFPDCRTDNLYQFGSLGVKVASIHLDEGSSFCDAEEPDYVSQGIFLDFSSDFTKAAVSIRGAAMAKLFHLPYDSRIKLNGFRHSWHFEEVSKEKLRIKALIPADESAGMAEQAMTVQITFDRFD